MTKLVKDCCNSKIRHYNYILAPHIITFILKTRSRTETDSVFYVMVVKGKSMKQANPNSKKVAAKKKVAMKSKKTDTKTSKKTSKTAIKKVKVSAMKAKSKAKPNPNKFVVKAAPKKTAAKKKAASKKTTAEKKKADLKKAPAAPSPPSNLNLKLDEKALKACKALPMRWELCVIDGSTTLEGYGVYADDTRCLAGFENGTVVDVDIATGQVKKAYKLPDGVKCIVGDGDFLYVGTNGGEIYDLQTGVPRLLSKIDNFMSIFWLDVFNGMVAASDSSGNVALVNCEGEVVWKKKSDGFWGWMCRMDETGRWL